MDVKLEGRGRGRPRNPDSDELIRSATLRLLARHGYDRCSIDAVADEAGVTRATVYRRFPTKADLITEAVCTMETLPEGLALDDTRACLVWMAEQFRSGISEADGLSIAASLYVQRREHPDMLARFRGEVILPGREKFVAALQAGVDRGTIRADADLGLVVDQIVGAYMSRCFTGAAFEDDWAERIVDQLWRSIAA